MRFLKFLLKKHKYSISQLVRIGDYPETFEIAALYYNLNLEPIYILKDEHNKLSEEREKYVVPL